MIHDENKELVPDFQLSLTAALATIFRICFEPDVTFRIRLSTAPALARATLADRRLIVFRSGGADAWISNRRGLRFSNQQDRGPASRSISSGQTERGQYDFGRERIGESVRQERYAG